MPAETTGRRLRMPADPARLELAERRDALVDRLTVQLETLEEELEQARGVREEAEAAQRGARGRAQRDRPPDRAPRLDAQRARGGARRARQDADERMQLKAELSAMQNGGAPASADDGSELDRVLRAREREGDEAELIGIAARAFNRSPHAERVREVAARQGRPKVSLGVVGVELPRRVLVAFAFGDDGARSSSRSTSSRARASVARAAADERAAAPTARGAGAPRAASSSQRLGRPRAATGGAGEQRGEQRLLRVQAVLGLIPDRRVRAVEHGLVDLLAVVRGQAVQHDAVGRRAARRAARRCGSRA